MGYDFNLWDDRGRSARYRDVMSDDVPHLIVNIKVEQPVSMGDFVGYFSSLASQFKKYIRNEHPDLNGDANLHITELRKGSIEAELVPWLAYSLPSAINFMSQVVTVKDFVKMHGEVISAYAEGGRVEGATRSDVRDFMNGVAAIAHDTNGQASLEAVYKDESGERQTAIVVKVTTDQAQKALASMEEHARQIDAKQQAQYQRVLMTFQQSNKKDQDVGKRTGEKVIIESISDVELPLLYASEITEDRIKHEIRDTDGNVYKKGFYVDVNVETRQGRPIAYAVMQLHQVIDIVDEDN